MSDDQVIENCGLCYRDDPNRVCLAPPHGCPKEVADLMKECWNRDVRRRPTSMEIHMFLSRKTVGYNPCDEISETGFIM